jgi:hypothetical protein
MISDKQRKGDSLGWNGTKDTVESALQLDILDLQEKRFLALAASVPWEIQWASDGKPCNSVGYVLEKRGSLPVSMRLQYTTTYGDQKRCDYLVSITSTSCNYGGMRLWFLCPGWKNGIACRRRCRKLYLAPGEHVFACRACHELTYESTQRSGSLFYELIERPMKIRDKAVATLERSRTSRRQNRILQRKEWAERLLKHGFLQLPGAAEILEPIFALESAHDFWSRRGRS